MLTSTRRTVWTALVAALAASTAGLSQIPLKVHSFDVVPASIVACTDGVTFTGQTTAASSLGIPITSEVWDATGTTLLATGDSQTFTAVGETFAFTVLGAFTAGSTVVVAATNQPGTNTPVGGTEGDVATATVADCSITAPALPGWALALLLALMLAGGTLLLGKAPGVFGSDNRRRLVGFLLVAALVLGASPAVAGNAMVPVFTKTFSPDTIGPGSTSMLTFTVDGTMLSMPADLMAFDDEFPVAISFADPAFVQNNCGGTLTLDEDDADSAFDVRLTDGKVGAGQVCTIVVNVTSATVGTHMNVSGNLTSTLGNSGTATADLTVVTSLPSFFKSFAPSTVEFGGTSTLTFLIDNQSIASAVDSFDFTDTLPPGMVIANPANASTTCTGAGAPTLTANPGTGVIDFSCSSFGGLTPCVAAFASCTVSVDVIGGAVGELGNVSGNLMIGTEPGAVGKAAAVLEVTGFDTLLALRKKFTDDPVAPGTTVTLEFEITNKSRDFAATGITFDDTIDPMGGMGGLTGLNPIGLPAADVCGTGSSLSFASGTLTLTGGALPAEGTCTFSVVLTVPAGADPGSYANTTTAIEGTIDGATETGNVAGDLLSVVAFPLLTKEFTNDPVGAGGIVTLEFTIFNSSQASALSDIEFLDELTDGSGGFPPDPTSGFLPFPVSVTLPPTPDPPCGGSSSLALVTFDSDRQRLSLTGGSLAISDGVPGGADTCTFSLPVGIPVGLAPGTYTNTTEEITAQIGMTTVTGKPASDDIVILAAPQLAKEFTDDPALPGGSVTLAFTLENPDPDNAASAIAFSDNLGAALTGLTITSVDVDTCGGTPSGVGTGIFGYTGGSLAADDGDTDPPEADTCTIVLTLSVPGSPPGGTFPNTTSAVSATVAGVAAQSPAASDDLIIAGLQFSKAFSGDPVIAGGTATLTFTLDNTAGTSPADDATSIFFTDNLDDVIPGLVATLPPTPNPPCGPGSSLFGAPTGDGGTSLTFSGGQVSGGSQCSFSVPVTVPATIPNPTPPPAGFIPTPDDAYPNLTSALSATIGGTGVVLPPAADKLLVDSTLLEIAKEFTDDPVAPGGTVTAKFTLTNLSAGETVTDIAFSDDLGAALPGLMATGAVNNCGGMSPTIFPSGLFTFQGGTLTPGASCMVTVTVAVPAAPLAAPPPFINTTSGVTGKVGALDVFGDPAQDELRVQLLKLEKDFTDDPAFPGGTVTLELTITNLGADAVSDLAFSDDLNAALGGLQASILPPVGVCGPGSAVTGTSFLSFTGGSLGGGASCAIPVTLTVPAGAGPGTYVNTTSDLVSQGLKVADAATALLEIEPPPAFSKVFSPDVLGLAQITTLTFTIDNSSSTVAATSLAFTDTFPAGLQVATPSNVANTCGGTVTAVAGTGTVALSGGAVAAGATCTLSVDIASTGMVGSDMNVSGDLTSSSGNSGPASDTVTWEPPPLFSKVFTPDSIGEGSVTTLTFTIDNAASAVAVVNADFLDMLPVGVTVAATPNITNTCGGTVVAPAGGVSISLSNGMVAAGAMCTLSVDVTPDSGGVFVNVTSDLMSSSGNSGTATDTLTGIACAAADGKNLTLSNDVVLGAKTFEVCDTITISGHYLVLGPSGVLTLRAGVAVILFNGVEFGVGSTVTIQIDPGLIP